MPEMNGIELAKHIRAINAENSIVMMGSPSDWSHMEKEADAAGVNHFISKPIFRSELINAMNICFGAEQASSDVREGHLHHRHDFATHTLLIAEDIEINREIIGAILEETKVAIDYAVDGHAAVALFQGDPEKYSLILMDVNMPEMNGYDATRAIRALNLAKAQAIPIIAMTANVFKEDIEKCIECGMNGHTGKPVDIEALLKILNEYLNVPEGALK
jgi:CheY-like chemotaxis protein